MLGKTVRKELSLDSAGLSFSQQDMQSTALAADGNHLVIAGDTLQGANISDQDRLAMKEYRRSMNRFARIVQSYGINTTIRVRRGIDINAGCGQSKADVLNTGAASSE